MPIRIVLAGLPQPLQDELERDLARDTDLAVICIGDHLEVLLAVAETRADAVILWMPEDDIPGIATHLTEEYPHLKILAIRIDAQGIQVYELALRLVQIGKVPRDALPEVLRATIRDRDWSSP
jgi:hypothetical protein